MEPQRILKVLKNSYFGKREMNFSKAYAKDLAWGLTLNGNPAIVMLKESYLHLENPKIESE